MTAGLLDGCPRLEQVEVRENLTHREEKQVVRQAGPEGIHDRPRSCRPAGEMGVDLASAFLVVARALLDEITRPSEDRAVAWEGAADVKISGATQRVQVVDQRPWAGVLARRLFGIVGSGREARQGVGGDRRQQMIAGKQKTVGLVEEHQVTRAVARAVQHAQRPTSCDEKIAVGEADADVDRRGEPHLRRADPRERLELRLAHPVPGHHRSHERALALERGREVGEVPGDRAECRDLRS